MKMHKLIDIPRFHKTPLALAVLVALQGAAVPEAFADGPPPSVGPEFQVNTYTTNEQQAPAMAMDADGDFVVVWQSNGQDGDGYGIFAQRYNATGIPQESGNPPKFEFPVNTITSSNQQYPAIAMDADGDFVVVWQGPQIVSDIYARRYDKNGNDLNTPEFRVNTTTTGRQWYPAVAMDAAGDFVVAWQSQGQDGSGWGIYAQRYNAAGVPQGSEFPVNTYTTNDQKSPAVAMDATTGDFVVVWESDGQDGSLGGIYAQRYTIGTNGVPQAQGSEFLVNTYTINSQQNPAVAMDATGNFVVTWMSTMQDGPGNSIHARIYYKNGTVLEDLTPTSSANASPALTMDANGNFVIAWGSLVGQTGGAEASWDIYAQRYNAAGAPQGSEFWVNTYSANVTYREFYGYNPSAAMAMNAAGNFKIVWQSFDGKGTGIFGQRYALACRCPVDPPSASAFMNPPPEIYKAGDKKPQYTSTWSPTGEVPAGTFTFIAKFCNNDPDLKPLTDLVSRTVPPLTGGFSNHLLNRHYGPSKIATPQQSDGAPPYDGASPSGVGSVLDFPANNNPPLINGYNDHVLDVGECVDVKYEIGLQIPGPFSFYVDIYGDDATLPGNSVTGTPCKAP
ncbi:MAG: hypothetical protein U1F76_08460 [Candidatus Competibacteraceae bacterium]